MLIFLLIDLLQNWYRCGSTMLFCLWNSSVLWIIVKKVKIRQILWKWTLQKCTKYQQYPKSLKKKYKIFYSEKKASMMKSSSAVNIYLRRSKFVFSYSKNMRNVCSILLSAFLSKIVLEIRKGLLYFRNSEIYYYSTKLGPPSCLKQPLKKCSYIARNMF